MGKLQGSVNLTSCKTTDHKITEIVGYNEKYPSGLRNVILWPPLSITLAFDIFPTGEANAFVPIPAKSILQL